MVLEADLVLCMRTMEVYPGVYLTCIAFLAFSFPFCVLCQRHSDDSLITLIVMYFNNSLTIWNTEINVFDKEKKSL